MSFDHALLRDLQASGRQLSAGPETAEGVTPETFFVHREGHANWV